MPARRGSGEAADFGRSAPAFPVVGTLLGAVVAGTAIGLTTVVSDLIAAGVALVVATVLTGGLHVDALADTADALGARSRESALAVMRDPAAGAFGTAALILVFLLEAPALAKLAASEAFGPIVASFALSRAIAPALGCLLPPARSDPSLATPLLEGSRARATVGILIALAIAVACASRSAPWLTASALGVGLTVYVIARRRFGGATGDVLGSAVILNEVLCLIVASGTH